MPSIRPEGVAGFFAEIDVGSHFFKAVAENHPDITFAVAIHVARRVHGLVEARGDGFVDQVATPVRIVAVREVDFNDVFPDTVIVVDVDPPLKGIGSAGPGQGEGDRQDGERSFQHFW